jgi:hypothetical protein
MHHPAGYTHVVEVTAGRPVYIAGQIALIRSLSRRAVRLSHCSDFVGVGMSSMQWGTVPEWFSMIGAVGAFATGGVLLWREIRRNRAAEQD